MNKKTKITNRRKILFDVKMPDNYIDFNDIISKRTGRVKQMSNDLVKFDDPFIKQKEKPKYNLLKNTGKLLTEPLIKKKNKLDTKFLFKNIPLSDRSLHLQTTMPTEESDKKKTSVSLFLTDVDNNENNENLLFRFRNGSKQIHNKKTKFKKTSLFHNDLTDDENNNNFNNNPNINSSLLPTVENNFDNNFTVKQKRDLSSYKKTKESLPYIFENYDGIKKKNQELQKDIIKIYRDFDNNIYTQEKNNEINKLIEISGKHDFTKEIFIYGKNTGKFLSHEKYLNDSSSVSKIQNSNLIFKENNVNNKFNLVKNQDKNKKPKTYHDKINTILESMENIRKRVIDLKNKKNL